MGAAIRPERDQAMMGESPSPNLPFSPSQTTVLIADDHPIFRQGLKQLIEKEPGFRVVAEAEDGETAFDLIATHAPAVAVLDLNMPGLDGFAVAQRARQMKLPVRIIILTMHKDELHFNEAINLGIQGYLIKDSAATEVIDCLKAVISGREYFSPALSSFLLTRRRRAGQTEKLSGVGDLTPTERRVLLLLSELKTTKQIAAELGVSPRTVDNHRAHICSKLDLQGTHALVKFAIQHKAELC
jgi:DNA-binding NarL/FixJ family response regulator